MAVDFITKIYAFYYFLPLYLISIFKFSGLLYCLSILVEHTPALPKLVKWKHSMLPYSMYAAWWRRAGDGGGTIQTN